ncbi:MAG: ABC transporter substrate-binding protein [Pseudomonadota bacterium]|nr:ABC transporter substrate-binding protein [Pseudomonadota bacterium]
MRRAAALLFVLSAPVSPAGDAVRGRLLYERGLDEDGRASATLVLGAGGQTAPSDRFPCASCHGMSGRGGTEAGQALPPVRWEVLSRPGSRARHAGYTPATLLRAVRTGIDADGEALSPVMPRYDLTRAQGADLVAWLEQMSAAAGPGVSGDTVTVGTLLPLSGPHAEQGRAAAALLREVTEGWNASGGVYGRRVRLEVRDAPTVAAAREALAELSDEVLCLVGPAGPGAEPDVLADAVARGLPVLAPASPAPSTSVAEPVFYFLPPLDEVARVAADTTVRRLEGACRISVAPGGDPWLDVLVARAVARGCREVPAGEATLAVLSGPDPGAAILRGEAAGEHPLWLVGPGGLHGLEALPATVVDRVVVALAVGPPDPDRPEARALAERAARVGSGPAARSAEARAWVATRLLGEGLARAGRDLDRPALVRALEDVRALQTGVTPALAFARGQHVGARTEEPTRLADVLQTR